MKSFSNTYIFIFSLAMVFFVAVLLSFVAMQLKPRQNMNQEIERKEDILRSVGKAAEANQVKDKNSYISEEFGKYITDSYVINAQGEELEDRDAFEVTLRIDDEIGKPVEERSLPVFVYEKPDETKKYIVPVRGKGLWGPIWGYVAFDANMNSIYGAVYDHAKETPGLGAEINTDWFQEEFRGKKIFDEEGNFVSVKVIKGGAAPENPHGVDAISGGTITSNGLEEMLYDCLQGYVSHFKEKSNQV